MTPVVKQWLTTGQANKILNPNVKCQKIIKLIGHLSLDI